ncbi:uncharacterized protein FA14DRAFT_163261 [Meira miltonrushii]|uniref:Zn(2)-C6 fungal-type domain-containing protein n=1 Tax=Meira miltonrushii TaxID=1280837 RepID=A0A316VI88_9BASI|nr:uncharacterized protein FA14DRAFT_163261 [Meira miltonrushii]PWN37349.1 hypothetical protein FA14DRAFT_163261 [Meira miltonrushii]
MSSSDHSIVQGLNRSSSSSNQRHLTSPSGHSSSSIHTPQSSTSDSRYSHHHTISTASSSTSAISSGSISHKPSLTSIRKMPFKIHSDAIHSSNGRKRKTPEEEGKELHSSPSRSVDRINGTQSSSNHSKSNSLTAQQQMTKRIKTARACDSCRRKKIRCDVIDDGGPLLGDPNNGNGGLTCAHCRQYGFDCTFFLPITETRFKKKREREAEEIAAAAAAAAAAERTHLGAGMIPALVHPSRTLPLSVMPFGNPSLMPGASQSSRQPSADDSPPPPPDTRVLGPTSLAYIVHSTAFVPGAAIEEHDLQHHQTFEVGASGDGIIKFHKPPKGAIAEAEDGEESADEIVRVPESLRGRLAGDVAEKLVNTYFEKLGFLFPVVTKSEFLHMSSPPPLMLYAICGIAALSREVPKEVLSVIKMTLHGMFKNVDILSNSNNNNVKSLLIMSLHSDIHGTTAVQAGSRYWNRVGAAVRMAQDLGLHRDASKRDDVDDDAFFLEQKRRIWGCCVTADRCVSISLGHPLAIDLTDCDVRLPSPYEILRYPSDLPAVPGADRPFGFNTEMLKLSILFGRVMKTIYSPTGLMKTTDEEIIGLLNDIDRWKDNLPTALQFRGAKESPAPAGILHISYSCLMHLFFRVFMRISYNCPQHLNFSLTIERMTTLIKISRESIAWVDLNEFYLDTMQFVSYGLVFCTTVQYHAWIRRGDQEALASIQKAHDCVMRFERQGEHDSHQDLSMRAKTAGVIALLHKSAIGKYKNTPNSGNLNPTAGVSNRRWIDNVRNIVFKPDLNRPGGGVYVATMHNLMLDDLPAGTMILQETEAGAVPALIRTNAENSAGAWRAVGDMANLMSNGANAQLSGQRDDRSGSNANDITRDLTHVAGGVWADAQGRPVDRQGSKLLTMIPVPGGETMIQSYPGGPRLSFSSIAKGLALPSGLTDNENQPPTFADPAWFSSLAAQAAAQTNNSLNANGNSTGEDAIPPTFNFSDLYTFDGQIAQPASLLPSNQDESSSSAAAGASMTSANAPALDPLSLDGMPGGPLDFAAWEQWFRGTNSSGGGGNDINNSV